MANKINLFACSFLVLLSGCITRLSPKEYISWVNNTENDLIKEYEIEGLHVKAIYRPTNYILLNDLGPETINQKDLDDEAASKKTVQYYELIISRDSVDFIKKQSTSDQDYSNTLYYFAFKLKDDIKLIYPGVDTMPVKLYHFERSYSLSNSKKMLLVFEDKGIEGDRVLHIDSPALPTGVVNLYFKSTAIKKASNIEIKL